MALLATGLHVVVQLVKKLTTSPVIEWHPVVHVRNFRDSEDIQSWLRLRTDVFAKTAVPVRPWSASDFDRQFLCKSWWNPTRMWLAETVDTTQLVGAVTLADRGRGDQPAVHWLMVQSAWRRRGVGRLLMSQLESFCWQLGWRQVQLESVTEWEAALDFYRSMGYVERTK